MMTIEAHGQQPLVVDRSIGIADIGVLHKEISQRLTDGRDLLLDLSQFNQISFCLSQLVLVSSRSFAKRGLGFSVVAPDDVVEISLFRAGIGSL